MFFFLYQPKNYNAGPKYVYLRLTINGAARELSTKRRWEPARWNAEAGRVTGSKEDAKALNQDLETLCIQVHAARKSLRQPDRSVPAEALKQVLTGQAEDKRMILAIFQRHNHHI